MSRFLLDTSALLTLRDEEKGVETVVEILQNAQQQNAVCYGCFITLMEIFYRVWKDEGKFAGRIAYEQVQALPIQWIHETKNLLEKAAELKALNAISLADAWVLATTLSEGAVLVHKDPEFELVECEQLILPYKT